MRLGDHWIDRQRRVRGGKSIVDFTRELIPQTALRKREERPGIRIIGINLDSAAADAHHPFLAPGISVIAGHPILPGQQVKIVRLRALRPALFDRFLLFR